MCRLRRGRRLARRRICAEYAPDLRDLWAQRHLDYCRPSQRATVCPELCGCSAVGSASPCQGEGRGFESRHPLEGCHGIRPQRWSGRVVRQRPAKPCTRVRFPSPPPFCTRAISSAGERFPDTEEVTGSIPVSRTSITAGNHRFYCPRRGSLQVFDGVVHGVVHGVWQPIYWRC